MEKGWKLPSVTGVYDGYAKLVFSTDSADAHTEISTVDWTQACVVSIESATFVDFTDANDMTNTEATAVVNMKAIKSGDCGTEFTFHSSIDCTTDNIMPYILSVDNEVFSAEG